ncbi:hypothetical protein JYT61_00380 [bacterium AH-315-E10]|nr:hypothetical protein [bacterium AH-315-E10]
MILKKKRKNKRNNRHILGFTLTEVLVVAAIVTSIPAAQYARAKKKAVQIECQHNLRSIGQLLTMHVMDDAYPKAAFYPKDPKKGKDSIRVILGGPAKIWQCPGLPDKLRESGLTFVYNDELSGKRAVGNAAKKWVLIEINCVSKSAPHAHPGGYNILFADGHVISSKKLPKKITQNQRAMIEQLEKDIEKAIVEQRLIASN